MRSPLSFRYKTQNNVLSRVVIEEEQEEVYVALNYPTMDKLYTLLTDFFGYTLNYVVSKGQVAAWLENHDEEHVLGVEELPPQFTRYLEEMAKNSAYARGENHDD